MCTCGGFTTGVLSVNLAYGALGFDAFKQLLSVLMHNLKLHLQDATQRLHKSPQTLSQRVQNKEACKGKKNSDCHQYIPCLIQQGRFIREPNGRTAY